MRRARVEIGTYALLIRVPRLASIQVGHLGCMKFRTGVYVYIGSALNSLEGRISRHFRRAKRTHWHIDYLLRAPSIRPIGFAVKPTVQRIECTMSRAIQKRARSSINQFGCSDCGCDSHLHHFRTLPDATRALSDGGFRLRFHEPATTE